MTQTNAKSTATLEIDALSYGPYGIGRLDGKATMVPHTAPATRWRCGSLKRKSATISAKRFECSYLRGSGKRRLAPMWALAAAALGNIYVTTPS